MCDDPVSFDEALKAATDEIARLKERAAEQTALWMGLERGALLKALDGFEAAVAEPMAADETEQVDDDACETVDDDPCFMRVTISFRAGREWSAIELANLALALSGRISAEGTEVCGVQAQKGYCTIIDLWG